MFFLILTGLTCNQCVRLPSPMWSPGSRFGTAEGQASKRVDGGHFFRAWKDGATLS